MRTARARVEQRRARPCAPPRAAGARHPEQAAIPHTSAEVRAPKERPDVEGLDPRYARLDFAEQLAFDARVAFARNLARGEAGMHLAEAALQVAAEDDAIASSSTVAFPVESYLGRIALLAEEVAAQHRRAAAAGAAAAAPADSGGGGAGGGLSGLAPSEAVAAVEDYLFLQQRLRPAPGGRSALPARTLLAHPGVHESAQPAYLNEVLVRRVGHPSALAIILHDVLQRLLISGDLDFACLVSQPHGPGGLPRATPLPNMTRALALDPSCPGAALNACSSEALAELLRHLKRAYWPFPWDTSIDTAKCSHGGFRGAAKSALGADDVTAEARAISATAAHRLQRGIFTSPGAGDLRRCIAAAERLVMLLPGDAAERRDLGVLYLHAGLFAEAGAELSEYLRRASARRSYSAGEEAEGAFDPFDLRLTRLLVELAASGGEAPRGEAPAAGGGPAEGPRRQTLLAPGAGGAAPKAAAVLDAAPERARGGGGGDGDGPARLMSVEKVLGAAASTDGGPGAAGGLLGAARGKLPLTW